MSKVFVGVDVSKEFSTTQGLDKNWKKLFYLRFAMNSGGFSELLKMMVKHAESITEVTVATESTGCYQRQERFQRVFYQKEARGTSSQKGNPCHRA